MQLPNVMPCNWEELAITNPCIVRPVKILFPSVTITNLKPVHE